MLLVPISAASWQASVASNQATIESGTVNGTLVAARLQFTTEPTVWNESILTGSELVVRSWEQDANVTLGVPFYRGEPYQRTSTHEEFTLTLAEARDRARVSIYAADGAAWLSHRGNSTTIEASEKQMFSDNSTASEGLNNPNNEDVGISDTSQFKSQPNWGTLNVEGNFTIRLVEIDFEVNDENATHQYKSGFEETDAAPGQPNLPIGHVGKTSYREIHLYVTNGSLELPAMAGGEIEYFIRNWTATAPSGIELRGVEGNLLGKAASETLDNQTVYLPGPVSLTNGTSQNGRLFYDAFTESHTVYLDGQPLTNPPGIIEPPLNDPTDPEPEGTTVNKWGPDWLITGGFALSLLGAALVGIRFQKPFWYVRWQMRSGNHAFVVKNTPRFFSKASKRKKSVLMHSLALLGRGRFEEATEFIFSLLPRDRPDEPTWDYMAAMALAGSGEFKDAKNHLTRCLTAAPQFIAEVEQNPLLIRLLSDSSKPGSEFT